MDRNYARDCIKQSMIVIRAEKTGDTDDPIGSRAIFNDYGLLPELRKPLRKQPGAEIRRASSRDGCNQAHGSMGPVCRNASAAPANDRAYDETGAAEQEAARNVH